MNYSVQLVLYYQLKTYLGGSVDLTLHNKDAGFPTRMLSLLGLTVTETSGLIEPGGKVNDDFTFNTYVFEAWPILFRAVQV